jgi:hypothetical protein
MQFKYSLRVMMAFLRGFRSVAGTQLYTVRFSPFWDRNLRFRGTLGFRRISLQPQQWLTASKLYLKNEKQK